MCIGLLASATWLDEWTRRGAESIGLYLLLHVVGCVLSLQIRLILSRSNFLDRTQPDPHTISDPSEPDPTVKWNWTLPTIFVRLLSYQVLIENFRFCLIRDILKISVQKLFTCNVLLHTLYVMQISKLFYISIYTVNHKNRDNLFLTIPLATLSRFLQFLISF